jgi:hypothetical protein
VSIAAFVPSSSPVDIQILLPIKRPSRLIGKAHSKDPSGDERGATTRTEDAPTSWPVLQEQLEGHAAYNLDQKVT